jgi:hypothetical protein
MAIAAWRKAQQRQAADKRAEFVDGPALEQHQGLGRRT